jgi:hypothetical protein
MKKQELSLLHWNAPTCSRASPVALGKARNKEANTRTDLLYNMEKKKEQGTEAFRRQEDKGRGGE